MTDQTNKSEIEFQRYKQDCRRRALDLASVELEYWYKGMPTTSVKPEKPDILEYADKYYQWMITIPA